MPKIKNAGQCGYCAKCGTLIPKGIAYCQNCGNKIIK